MTKAKVKALASIKALRAQISDNADCTATAEMWETDVLEALDQAADLIEFPA